MKTPQKYHSLLNSDVRRRIDMIPEHLETSNLSMRPFETGDGCAVFAYWQSDPGWERFNASVPLGFTKEGADNFTTNITARDRTEKPSWAILHDGTVMGVVSLNFEQNYRIAQFGKGQLVDEAIFGLLRAEWTN